MKNEILDPYERNARLYPALIVLFPLVLDVYLIIPEIRNIANTLVTLVISLGILQLLANIARSRGKSKENMLFEEWGGVPTSRLLRHSDDTIDPFTKSRYHNYLMESIKNYKIPSPEDELVNIKTADRIYESGVRWLREKTRDKNTFPLVFKENVGYGFSRNLWALKNVSIWLLFSSLILNTFMFYIKHGINILSYTYEYWIANAISFALMIVWIFFINKAFVRSSAEAYARALLAVCDDVDENLKKRIIKDGDITIDSNR